MMKKVSLLLLGVAALSITACNKNANEVAADNIEANADNMADNMDAMASNTTNDAASDALSNQADALKEKGDNVADNVAAGNMTEAQGNASVNAM